MHTKRFPGVYASLAEIAEFIKEAVTGIGFSASDLFALETAVDEAVSNIIEHAYRGEGKGDIVCSLQPLNDGLKIILEDNGQPFDPSCVPIPDLSASLDERSDHGLGVYMMCQLLDDIHFEFLEDKNRLTLVKKKAVEPTSEEPLQPLPLWKHYLRLGEELLKQPDAKTLAAKFNQTVQQELTCKAELWLAQPYYPLPGEPGIETLPCETAPEVVRRAWDQHQIASSFQGSQLALPVVTQSFTLGILYVGREEGSPFTPEEQERLESLVAIAALSMQVNRQVALKNWRNDQISLVRSVSSQIANVMDLDELCQRVTTLIQCSFNYYHVSVFTIEEGMNELLFRASSLECAPRTTPPLDSIRLGSGLVGEVAVSGKEILARDVEHEPRYRPVSELPETRSEATLPLVVENRILGVLDVQSNVVNGFHETDMLVLRSLADNIALAVEGARLFHNLSERAEQMSAVAEVNYALSSILDLDELLKEVVTLIHNRFAIPLVHIYTVHPGRKKVIFQAGSGQRAQRLKSSSFAFDLDAPLGMIPNVGRTGISMLANDVSSEPLFKPSKNAPHETKSEMTIPLKFGDDVLGVLDMQSDEINKFNQGQKDLFEGMASGIALSIRNATLFRSENWRRQVAETFKDAAGMLSSDLALDDLLNRILLQLENTLPCDSAAIWLVQKTKDDTLSQPVLKLAAVRGAERNKVVNSREASEAIRRFLDMAIENKQPVLRDPTDPYGPLGAAGGYPQDYSSIAVPLLSNTEVIGVLTLAHHFSGRYGSEATLIASTFASYAAVAIENASLYANAQADAWSSTVLLQVAEAMQSITTVDELMATIVRLTPLLVGVNQCAVFLRDASDNRCRLEAWHGFTPKVEESVLSDDESITLLKMRLTGKPVFINDPEAELGLTSIMHNQETGTLVLIPLISRGDVLGSLLVAHNSNSETGIRNEFNDQTLAILQGIARQASVTLENIRLLENRQEEAYITAVLLQVAQAVVSQNKLDDILDTIVHLMPILVGVDACVILQRDEKSSICMTTHAAAATHIETEGLLGKIFSPGEFALLDGLFETNIPLVCHIEADKSSIEDWASLKWVQADEVSFSTGENWLIGFPLTIKGVPFGALLALESNIIPAFHPKRLELMRGVAQQTTLAIQNERLKQEMVGRERIEREFQLARQIQQAFLPESYPQPEGWQIDLRWQTAREVGGDFYDIIEMKDGKVAFVIADVADKGMPAALYMTVTRTLIRATLQTTESPDKVLERVNELLESESRNGMFVTCVLAVLDPVKGVVKYSNAGHNLPLLVRANSGQIKKFEKDGIALGVIPQAQYHIKQIQLEPGDLVLFYTDGVTEAYSSSGELFSEERLNQILQDASQDSAPKLLGRIEDSIRAFRNGEPASDDMTMIAIFREK